MSIETKGGCLFDLTSHASFDEGADVSGAAFTESNNYIYGFLLSENKRLNFCHFPKHRKEDKLKDDRVEMRIQSVQWFSNESQQARHCAFNPLGDYCLLVTQSLDLYVVCISYLLPDNVLSGKVSSGLSWNREPVSSVFKHVQDPELDYGQPSCLHWWETSDFIQMGIIGTNSNDSELGHIILVNLITGAIMSSCPVKGDVRQMNIMIDNALDSVYLLVTTVSSQWRILVEQRSTGYVWGHCNDTCHVTSRVANGGHESSNGEQEAGQQRTRLQSIKQMSVDRIANLRSRLAEGRRLLKSRSEAEMGGQARMECISSDISQNKWSVQKQTDQQTYVLAGFSQPDQLLTLHSTELDRLQAQSQYKLPSHLDTIIITGKLILVTSSSSSSLSICSSMLSELKSPSQSFKQESVIQSFNFSQEETILSILPIEQFIKIEPRKNCTSSSKTSSPFRKLICVTKDENGVEKKEIVMNNKCGTPGSSASDSGSSDNKPTKDISSSNSSPCSVFEQKTVNSLDNIKAKHSLSLGSKTSFVVVTNRNVYLLRMTQNPVDLFLSHVMQGHLRDSEVLVRSFGLERTVLMELAGDIRLYQGDIASAVSLYRQAGTKHMKTALKLASCGNIPELLSFLQALFNSQNLEIGSADRVHLSNLSLLCQLHQLCSAAAVSKYYFEEKLLYFLKCNRWYDTGLAVRQCMEVGAWKLVAGMCQYLGLENDLGMGLVLYNVGGMVTRWSSDTGQEILSLLLSPHLLPSMLDSPGAGVTLVTILTTLLPNMSSSQLNTLLHNTCPARRDLQLLFCGNNNTDCAEEFRQFRRSVLELFIVGCLGLLKRKTDSGQNQTLFDKQLLRLSDCSNSNDVSSPDGDMGEVSLSCGHSHTLYLCPGGDMVSWGGAAEARLGQGRLVTPTAPPTLVHLFRSLGVRVCGLGAGKQHSVALTQAGVYTWGCNKYGQLGHGLSPGHMAMCATPRHVSGLQDVTVTKVSAGQYHTACLDTSGRLYTWGWGVHGQLGHGGVEDVTSPTMVTWLRRHVITDVSCGYAHTMVLTREGRVYTWGCGLFGQLGNGKTGKQVRPVRVRLPGKVVTIVAGYFHNIVILESGLVMTWGANPQILRLEAQQRKKEKILQKQLEEKRRQEMVDSVESEQTMESLHPQDSSAAVTDQHLSPSLVDTSHIRDQVVSAAAGSQHSALLTLGGQLYTWGRNLEGQLGLGNRQSVKVPTLVTALASDNVTMVGAGADFTVAVNDAGSVLAWGSNAAGQLGRAPLEDPSSGQGQDNSKVLVMKTTKRIIRLQHGLQNSCDVPRPVQGLSKSGVYSTDSLDLTTSSPHTLASTFYTEYQLYKQFPNIEPVFGSKLLQQFLHLTVEKFFTQYDSDHILRQCLIMENPQLASKLSLLLGKISQAFDLSIQAVLKHKKNLEDLLLETFLYFFSLPGPSNQDKCSLFERLVCCWNEQHLNFSKLEDILLSSLDPTLLNIVILTLFCPSDQANTNGALEERPHSRSAEVQLVDLFSPEFNLKIGDIFSKSGGQSKVMSEDMSESENYSEKLRRIVTERMETDTIQ